MDAQTRPFRFELPFLVVSGLAVYFAVALGLSGVKAMVLLEQGTADYTAAALARALGYAFEPTLDRLMLATAIVSAAKLTIAGYFTMAAIERWSAMAGDGKPRDHDALDIALIGALALTLFLAVLAWIAGDAGGLRTHMVHTMLICVAVGLTVVEREGMARDMSRVGYLEGNADDRPQPGEVLRLDRGSH